METLEKNLWSLLKGKLPPHCHAQRIETGSTGLGIPDVNLCLNGIETWVELKVVKGLRVELSPQQVVWHYRRARALGSSCILARDKFDGKRKGKGDHLYLWAGADAQAVAEQGIDVPALGHWQAPFAWDEVLAAIFSGPSKGARGPK